MSDPLEVSEDERAQEQRFVEALGLRPPGEVVPRRPFALPPSRRSFVVPSAWHWHGPPRAVRAADLAADLDVLALALEKAYAGYESAAAAGWDWPSFLARWRARLAAKGDSETAAAFAPWAELATRQVDNHSGPVLGAPPPGLALTAVARRLVTGRVERWRLASGAEGDLSTCAVHLRRALRWTGRGLEEAAVLSWPGSLGTWTAVRVDGAWIEVQALPLEPDGRDASIAALLGGGPDRLAARRLSPTCLYVRVPTLSLSLAGTEPGLEAGALADASSVVLDLRGNGGGAHALVREALSPLLGGGDALPPLRHKQSCLTPAMLWGFAQWQLRDAPRPLPPAVRARAQSALSALFDTDAAGCPVAWHDEPSGLDFRRHAFPGRPEAGAPRLVVLVDGACGSDGELLALAAAARPGSALVGTFTAGVGGFARPGRLVLPRTGVAFRLATATCDVLGGGAPFEGRGLPPDVIAPAAFAPADVLAMVSALERLT